MELNFDREKIKFTKDICRSEFHNNLLEEEYHEIIEKHDLLNDHLHIDLSYMYEKEESLELGLYITNNSEQEIHIIKLPISLYEKSRKIYDKNIDIMKNIMPKKSIFIEIDIKNILSDKKYDIQDIKLEVGDLNQIANYPYINIDIDNIPKFNVYKRNREINNFLNNLSIIRNNELRLDIFKVGEVEDGFCIIFLIRNSSKNKINIKSIPLTIHTGSDYIIYKGTQIFKNSLNIDSNKGIFYSITIPFTQMAKIKGDDLSKYKVEFK